MKIEKKILNAVKICSHCQNKTELLRFRCPYCSSEIFFMISPNAELDDAMHAHQKLSQDHVDRGSRLFMQGMLDEALQEFSKAIEANPWNATAHGNIGVIFLRQGKPKKAHKYFKRALEIDPRVPGGKKMEEEARKQLK